MPIRECKKHGKTEHVKRSDSGYRCKKCRIHSVNLHRQRIKEKLVKYFGGRCTRCGYNTCIDALCFHHRNPNIKEFGLSKRYLSKSLETLVGEGKKCDLLCANCHAEIHSMEK